MTELAITFNGSPVLSMGNLVSGEVETATNLPSRFRLVFTDPSHTMVGTLGVSPGTATSISSGDTVLFVGEVTALEAEYDQHHGTQVIVRGYDKLHRLQTGRAAKAFSPDMGIGDIVSMIASSAGLTPGDTSGAPSSTPPWIGQRDISSWDLLVGLAEEAGAVISLDDGHVLNFTKPTHTTTAPPPATPEMASTVENPLQLVPDTNLLRVRAVASGNQQATTVEVHAWDTNQNQLVVGTATAAASSVDATYTPSAVGGTLNGTKFVDARTGLPDEASASALATSLADRLGAAVGEIEGIAKLTPQMKANVAVSLGNLGAPFDGKYVLSSVRHHFSSKTGNRTFFAAAGRQDRTILGLTGGADSANDRKANRFVGVINGIVTDVVDPAGQGRVKVQIPMLDNEFVVDWARVVSPGAGNNYGAYLPPNVGDEVLMAFENNDMRRPVVLGGLYNGQKLPALGDSASLVDNGKFTRRGIVSTAGDMLLFFDGSAKEGISLLTSDKGLKLSLNKTKMQIAITASSSGAKIMITSDSDITIKSNTGDISLQGNNVKIEAQAQLSAKGGAGMSLDGGPSLSAKGGTVSIN